MVEFWINYTYLWYLQWFYLYDILVILLCLQSRVQWGYSLVNMMANTLKIPRCFYVFLRAVRSMYTGIIQYDEMVFS